MGRRQEALQAAGESVRLYRQLAEASPGAYLPDLAVSLNNLASHLREVGQDQEALQAGEESVRLYRQLAEASPGAYLPNLAGSLSNLARLSEDGQRATQKNSSRIHSASSATTHSGAGISC